MRWARVCGVAVGILIAVSCSSDSESSVELPGYERVVLVDALEATCGDIAATLTSERSLLTTSDGSIEMFSESGFDRIGFSPNCTSVFGVEDGDDFINIKSERLDKTTPLQVTGSSPVDHIWVGDDDRGAVYELADSSVQIFHDDVPPNDDGSIDGLFIERDGGSELSIVGAVIETNADGTREARAMVLTFEGEAPQTFEFPGWAAKYDG